jgi:hypothetical protein
MLQVKFKTRFSLDFQYKEMKMQRLNKQPLEQTLLPAQEEKPRRTPRSYYSDQDARTKDEKKRQETSFPKNSTIIQLAITLQTLNRHERYPRRLKNTQNTANKHHIEPKRLRKMCTRLSREHKCMYVP